MNSFEKVSFIVIIMTWMGLILAPVKEKPVEIDAPEAIEATTTSDLSLIKYIDKGTMKASWYGPGFDGRLTANGEIYDQMAFTAAHKSWKFGTLLRVTNTINKRSIVIRINDRGPYIEGRSIDLSKGAAQELRMIKKGVVRVKIEEIRIAGIR